MRRSVTKGRETGQIRPALALALATLLLIVSRAGAQQGGVEAIEFESHGTTLRGHFFRGTGASPRPTLVFYHGYPGRTGDVLGIGAAAAAAGWNVLVYLPRGLGESEGIFTMTNSLEDVRPALDMLRSRADALSVDTARLAVGGYSFGGWLAFMGAARHPELRCVASVGPANQGLTGRMIRRDPDYLAYIRRLVEPTLRDGSVRHVGGWEAQKADLLAHAEEYDLIMRADDLRDRPALVIGGWRDEGPTLDDYIVPLVRALRGAGNERVTPVALDDTHAYRRTRREVQDIVVGWLREECEAQGPE